MMRYFQLIVCIAVIAPFIYNCEETEDPVEKKGFMEVMPMSVLLFVEGTQQLTADLYDSDSMLVEEALEWNSSDETIATVSSTGLVTGVGGGHTQIIVASEDVSDTVVVRIVAPINLTKYSGNPVLDCGSSGSWDDLFIWHSSVLKVDADYHMWYQGAKANPYTEQLGYATSSDGMTWVKYNTNPILSPIGNEEGPNRPCVLHDGTGYAMWYVVNTEVDSTRIRYATSADGAVWDVRTDPVLEATESWESDDVGDPNVIYDGDLYRMWYMAGESYSFGTAFSEDGINWTKYAGNPIMEPTVDSWEAAAIINPLVLMQDDVFHMIYTGDDDGIFLDGSGGVGHAISQDGINWLKYPGNPILTPGPENADQSAVMATCALMDDEVLKLWYIGISSSFSSARLCMASSE